MEGTITRGTGDRLDLARRPGGLGPEEVIGLDASFAENCAQRSLCHIARMMRQGDFSP
jgi:hypothetical protein